MSLLTDFTNWTYLLLLNNQETCVINRGKTSKYFRLERGSRQGDPISAYLYVIVPEVVFWIIKETSNIVGFEIFLKKFIFTAYADDTTFLLKNTESVINIFEIFKHFSQIKMWSSWYRFSERGKSGTLWYEMCKPTWRYH